VTYDTPLQGKILPRLLGFTKTKLCRKFEVPSASSFEDMFDRMPKIVGVTWPVPRTLWRKFLMHPVGISFVKLRTKFEVSSSNSFEDISDRFARKCRGHVT